MNQSSQFLNSLQNERSSNVSCNSIFQKLPEYIKQINTKDIFQESNLLKNIPTRSIKFECQMNKIGSEISTTLQTSNKIYLFLCRTLVEGFSQLIIYEYKKEDGMNKSLEINGIKGKVNCIKACFAITRKNCKMSQNIKNKKSNKLDNQNSFELVILLGTLQGYLKVLKFTKFQQNMQQSSYKIESIKIDFLAINYLVYLNPQFFFNTNLCLALSKTNRVYLINIDTLKKIASFMPTIVSCDVGLSLSVNYLDKYFIQATQGGYIIFWNFSEKILELIRKSHIMIQNDDQNNINKTFLDKQTFHCIVPLSIFHSASIQGLKWIQLYGSLLVMITKKGIFKLIAYNNQNINGNQYCSFIQHQIQDGYLISDVKFFPQIQTLFIVKSLFNDQRSKVNNYLPMKLFDLRKFKKGQSKQVKPYVPSTSKDWKINYLPNNSFSKSLKTQSNSKCYLQKLKFNCELQIQQIYKIYPSHIIQHIQSLQISQEKDIIILRSREFYLIGATKIFINDD